MAQFNQQWGSVNSSVYAQSPEESDKAYSKWASSYDEDVAKLGYAGNTYLVKHSMDCVKNEPDTLMLDVAAGTGLTAQAFRDAGFKGILDAVELNAEMLEIAKEKGLYRKTICYKLSAEEALPVESESYDIVAIAGAFMTNNLPQGCIIPVVDTIKRGGLLIFNSRMTNENAEYQAILVNIVESMVQAKKIELVKKETVPYFQQTAKETGGSMRSLLCIYRKL